MRRVVLAFLLILYPVLAAPAALAQGCAGATPLTAKHDETIPGKHFDPWLLDEAVRFYTNAERCRRGLIPVRRDTSLMRSATGHSQDMARLNFFDHVSPVPGRRGLGERVEAAGGHFEAAGENIFRTSLRAFPAETFYVIDQGACHFTSRPGGPRIPAHTYRSLAQHLVAGWMASPGHRDNILDRDWTRVGHGMAFRPDPSICGELFVTQNFAY